MSTQDLVYTTYNAKPRRKAFYVTKECAINIAMAYNRVSRQIAENYSNECLRRIVKGVKDDRFKYVCNF